MKWLDVQEIAEILSEKFPEMKFEEIRDIKFSKLYNLVMNLENFEDSKENCNEKILEAIQANWIEEIL